MICDMRPNIKEGKIYRGKLFFDRHKEWRSLTYFVDRIASSSLDGSWYAGIRVYVSDGYEGPVFTQLMYFATNQVGAFERVPLHEEVIFKLQFDTKWGKGGGLA